MRTNLDGVFYVARAVAKHMIGRERGKIVNICSLMSEVGRPTIAPYTAAKGAVKMLTKAMCADWARYNIQVNGIDPAPAPGRREELVGAAIFLTSSASDFVNGQIVYVDGGVLAAI